MSPSSLDRFVRDVLHGGRQVADNPVFFAFVVLTMALGIGFLTAVFSVVHAVLLEPLPYPDPQELVSIQSIHPEIGNNILSRVEVLEGFREGTRTLETLAAVQNADLQLLTDEGSLPLRALLTTPNLFDMLGATAVRGRLFRQQEGRFGMGRVAVLSHRLWQELDGRGPVVGRSLRFTGDPVIGEPPGQVGSLTVVGVLPEGFRTPFPYTDPDLWIADSFDAERVSVTTHAIAFGRLADGVGLSAAENELAVVFDRLRLGDSEWRTRLVPLRDFLVGDLRRALEILFLGGLLLLLVASANTTNLLLAREGLRARETAVRRALGADRGRVVRQRLAESVIPALIAGAAGLGVALVLLRLLRWIGTDAVPSRFALGLEPVVLGFVLLVTLATHLLLAIVPVVGFTRSPLADTLQGRSASSIQPTAWTRFALVGMQVSLALVLVVASVLLGDSLLRLRNVDLGFDRSGLLTSQLSLSAAHYPEATGRRSFYQQLLREVRSVPGVEEAGVVNLLPFSGSSAATRLAVENGSRDPGADEVEVQFRGVSAGYLEAMGIPLVAGRRLEEGDLYRPVVVVSEKTARLLWGETDPLGQRVKVGGRSSPGSWSEVVGVVGDVRHDSLTGDSEPTLYMTYLSPNHMTLVVRSASGRPEDLVKAVRQRLALVDPVQVLSDVETMVARIEANLGEVRLSTWLMGLLGFVTLVLATTGVYATSWQAVVERRREIGVRYALGARQEDVVRLFVIRVARWLLGGLVLGLVGAVAFGRYLAHLLFEVSPTQPLVLFATTALVALVALLGTYLPTRKGARVDPASLMYA